MDRKVLSKFVQVVSTVGGLDKAYKVIIYTLRLVAHRLKTSKPQLAQSLAAFTSPLADTRMVMRFFGLFGILDGIQSSKGSGDLEANFIETVQTLSMLIYYPAEHIYWLSTHKVIELKDADNYSRYSCRAWALYIVLDIYTIVKKLAENKRNLGKFDKAVSSSLYAGFMSDGSGSSPSASASASPETEFVSMTKRKELYSLRKEKKRLSVRLLGACCDLPMALHWSTASYPLNDILVTSLGACSGLISWYLTWTAT